MRNSHSIGPVLAYHGCDFATANQVLQDEEHLAISGNDYDWLGPGIYFWVDSPLRAMQWAFEQKDRGTIETPYAIGAYVSLGNCLNLTDAGALQEVIEAYEILRDFSEKSETPLPANSRTVDVSTHILRYLDCAVISTVHQLRKDTGRPPYDTVLGVFEEGGPLYPGSGFRKKSHIQIAVLTPNSIVNYFPVRNIKRLRDEQGL